MADTDTENVFGVVDKRRNPKGSNTSQLLAVPANYDDVDGLRARLTDINSTSFSVARLNAMTKNDMVYAVRLADDPGVT